MLVLFLMDNTNPLNELHPDLIKVTNHIRKTVLVSNMALATAMEHPFMATYESGTSSCVMALKPDNKAIVSTLHENVVLKSDIVLMDENICERKSIYQCGTTEEAINVWEIIYDKMEEWLKDEVSEVDL